MNHNVNLLHVHLVVVFLIVILFILINIGDTGPGLELLAPLSLSANVPTTNMAKGMGNMYDVM